MKNIIGWFVWIIMVFALTATGQTKESKFVLQGEGRATDMTSIEKKVSPDQALVVTIKGNSRYRAQSKGKFSLYKEKRRKIKEVRFALQPDETKSWEFPSEEKINLVSLGVYGKGEIKVVLLQGVQDAVQENTGAGPVIAEQASPTPAAAVQPREAGSGTFARLLKEAEKSYLNRKTLEAVEILKKAVLDIWDEVPLTIKNVRLVEDMKTYVPRTNNTFSSGEKMHFNAQIFGYHLKPVGGAYSINFSTDVYFLQGGEILTGQQNFGKFDLITPLPNTAFRLDLTYWLTDAPAGVYDIQTVVHDQNSGQSTKFTTQVEMK